MQKVYKELNKVLSVDNDSYSTLATPALLASGRVPISHKRAADNYIVIKRLYKAQSIKSYLLNTELQLLKKYNFSPLSQMSIKDVNLEIIKLQEMAFSVDEKIKNDADSLIQIREKELKYIISSNYSVYSSELNDGYKALEKYFEEITKFYNLPH